MVWVFFWCLLVTNDPLSHPSIRREELAIMDQIHTKEVKVASRVHQAPLSFSLEKVKTIRKTNI